MEDVADHGVAPPAEIRERASPDRRAAEQLAQPPGRRKYLSPGKPPGAGPVGCRAGFGAATSADPEADADQLVPLRAAPPHLPPRPVRPAAGPLDARPRPRPADQRGRQVAAPARRAVN